MTSQVQVRGVQGFCDETTKAVVLKRVTMGLKKFPRLFDVIYIRPLRD